MPHSLVNLGKSVWTARLEMRLALVATACLVWVFWPTLAEMATRWGNESRYSHGFIVPLFAIYLAWSRRGMLAAEALLPSWWGFALLAFGLALRFAGTYIYFDWLGAVALLPCLAGLVVLVIGWRGLAWSWPAIAFLAFMIPLPFRLEVALAQPLQRIATISSTFMLQTLGLTAYAEGNVIRLGEIPINVAEACSGLNMLLVFFALACGVTLVARITPLEKIIVVLSAVPIALATNVLRILVTAILYKTVGGELAELFFHDMAGWLMPVVALGMLWIEVRLLAWVLVPDLKEEPMLFSFSKSPQATAVAPAGKTSAAIPPVVSTPL